MFRTTRPGAHGGDDSSDGAAPTAKVGFRGAGGTPIAETGDFSQPGWSAERRSGTHAGSGPARQPALSPTLLTRALARGASVTLLLSRSILPCPKPLNLWQEPAAGLWVKGRSLLQGGSGDWG